MTVECRARRITAFVVTCLSVAWAAAAQDVRVMTSGAFTEACTQLAPVFERATGHTMALTFGHQWAAAQTQFPAASPGMSPADVVILARSALDDLVARGQVIAASRVDLVRSKIGMAVRAGAPRPDISTVDAFRQTLLRAKSIGYSSSASGVYLSTELFPRLGIAEQIKTKLKMSEGTVGTLVAAARSRSVSSKSASCCPFRASTTWDRCRQSVQRETIFSAGIVSWAKAPDVARSVLEFFTSPANAELIRKTGLDPIHDK